MELDGLWDSNQGFIEIRLKIIKFKCLEIFSMIYDVNSRDLFGGVESRAGILGVLPSGPEFFFVENILKDLFDIFNN